eukprot:29828-Ditylum_brightwellii.AAC.1
MPIFDTLQHGFVNANDTDVGIAMCKSATRDQSFSTLIPTTSKNWKVYNRNNSLFDDTYMKVTPSTWNQKFL